ncbi:MAG: hypothetical protein LJF30_15375 [Acidobacteria bacterium]|jgi:alpha-D-xyloside xylohydrolase|nr:hypothetical protein [Acidobacteriota bacterium]
MSRAGRTRDPRGNVPYEDAVLDFTNPAAVGWYQEKIAGLKRLGVGAIKVDFGEARGSGVPALRRGAPRDRADA